MIKVSIEGQNERISHLLDIIKKSKSMEERMMACETLLEDLKLLKNLSR